MEDSKLSSIDLQVKILRTVVSISCETKIMFHHVSSYFHCTRCALQTAPNVNLCRQLGAKRMFRV